MNTREWIASTFPALGDRPTKAPPLSGPGRWREGDIKAGDKIAMTTYYRSLGLRVATVKSIGATHLWVEEGAPRRPIVYLSSVRAVLGGGE